MEKAKELEKTVGTALPEFIGTPYLLKAAAMLAGGTETECGKKLREAIEANGGEVFGGLVDFLAEVFDQA